MKVGTQEVDLEEAIMMAMMGTALMEAVASIMGLMRIAALTVVTMKVATMLVTVGVTGVVILIVVTTLVMGITVRGDGVTLRVAERMLMMEEEGERVEVDSMEILETPEVTVTVTDQMATPMSMAAASMMAETMAVGETGSNRPPRMFIHMHLISGKIYI